MLIEVSNKIVLSINDMPSFVELTSNFGHPVLVNADSISYIEPYNNGSKIHLGTSKVTSSDNSGTIRSVSGSSEVIYVKESFLAVKRKVFDL